MSETKLDALVAASSSLVRSDSQQTAQRRANRRRKRKETTSSSALFMDSISHSSSSPTSSSVITNRTFIPAASSVCLSSPVDDMGKMMSSVDVSMVQCSRQLVSEWCTKIQQSIDECLDIERAIAIPSSSLESTFKDGQDTAVELAAVVELQCKLSLPSYFQQVGVVRQQLELLLHLCRTFCQE